MFSTYFYPNGEVLFKMYFKHMYTRLTKNNNKGDRYAATILYFPPGIIVVVVIAVVHHM